MTEDSVMKIADFGLARDIHHIDYYKKTTNVSGAGEAVLGHSDQRRKAGSLVLELMMQPRPGSRAGLGPVRWGPVWKTLPVPP